jgi:two-component system phosphate regulon sensor histidine kinase PhoR
VRFTRSWLAELRKVTLLLAAGAGVGWLLGVPLLGCAAAALLVLTLWFYQLRRIQLWLSEPAGEPPEAGGVWGDIFDQIYHLQRHDREARSQLQSTVTYLRDSFAALRDGAVMVDSRGNIEWSNRAAERLLGLQYPRDRGQALLNLIRAPDFHDYYQGGDFSEPLTLAAPARLDIRLQIEITGFGAGDRLLFARDVTKVLRLEEMRRDFVANVSHELRTPLTVISGYVSTLLDNADTLEPRYLKALQQMSQQAGRMETLLRDLLWLARIEAMEGEEKRDPVDMRALLHEVRQEALAAYPARDIGLALKSDAGIRGDYQQLYSAVSNLVFNALKYSAADQPVAIRWLAQDGAPRLEVEDHGVGIAPEHLPRITERFYRIEASRSSQTGGTGLGLAIVKHVLAAHGARLEVVSEPGRGSTFSAVFSPNS